MRNLTIMSHSIAGLLRLHRISPATRQPFAALFLAVFLFVQWNSAVAQSNAFTIQIASREVRAEAETLATQLNHLKVKAEITAVEIPGRGPVYRVRVGRFGSLSAARIEAEKLMTTKVIHSYWIAKTTFEPSTTLHSAAATAPNDATRNHIAGKEKVLPGLNLGEFLTALSDRWSVRVPENMGVYTASIIYPKTRTIRTAVVLMNEARMQQLAPPFIKRQELLHPIEMRFEPGIKNSPAQLGMKFAQADTLTNSLRSISGYQDLAFDERGYLVLGKRVSGGSELARMLLRTAVESSEVFEIESVEGSDTVAFGAFISSQFNNPERGAVAFNRIQLDFKDFAELRGDASLIDSFDPGFVFLHELAHGVWELPDEGRGGLGECEAFINQIRRQLGLPERLRYHYQVRGQSNGGELGEMLFMGQDTAGRRRTLKLIWDNRVVNSNIPAASKGSATKPLE